MGLRHHIMGDGRRIAFRHTPGAGPCVVFLPGYMSDMSGSKAGALGVWAERERRECLLLDYSGCGSSSGEFADGTLSRWRGEVLALIDAQASGSVILVGSSMGGWLMLLAGEKLGDRLHALVGIAAAPDFTEWGRSEAEKAQLARGVTVFDPNHYGPEPRPMHPSFWADGQANRMLDREILLDCPVRLVHGMRDEDVPWEVSQRLAAELRSSDIHLTLIKDGDHRLSREQDITLLLRTVASL
ncbi:alpha/beta fold hydrolase [Tsuneonella sp. HG249]